MNQAIALLQKVAGDVKALLDQYLPRRDVALTDRAKVLIGVAAGVVILSGLFGMQRIVAGLERRYATAQADMMRLKAQIETKVWQERKQQGQILKSQLEERLWAAQTPGLADAGFERWLRERLTRYRLDPLQQIQVRRIPAGKQAASAPGSDPLSDLQRMTAKVVIPFEQAGLTGFLADVAEGDKAVVVDRLNVRSGRNARVEMDVSAFYRPPERN